MTLHGVAPTVPGLIDSTWLALVWGRPRPTPWWLRWWRACWRTS
jgi:hypothetical protein